MLEEGDGECMKLPGAPMMVGKVQLAHRDVEPKVGLKSILTIEKQKVELKKSN